MNTTSYRALFVNPETGTVFAKHGGIKIFFSSENNKMGGVMRNEKETMV